MKRRKDKRGNQLRTGESQREDGRYQYRYVDNFGDRKTVYANSLTELRKRESIIQQQKDDGVNYSEGNISIIELVDRYLALKKGVKISTISAIKRTRNVLSKKPFVQRSIQSVKTSDAKLWFLSLQKEGVKRGTISTYRNVLCPAFRMAVEEDILRKNPFSFKLSDVLENDAEVRKPLTAEQVSSFLDFCRNDSILRKSVDTFIILLGTGIRVSEFCGLTKQDVDFEKKTVSINKQLKKLVMDGRLVYTLDTPKSNSGTRVIPLTDEVLAAFRRMIDARDNPKVEILIDGRGGFISLSTHGYPKESHVIEYECKAAWKKYNKAHSENPLPKITPHVFRHTFCTNMANIGMDVNALQYIMGHAKASTTMNVYTHKSLEHALEQFEKCKHKICLGS